MAARSVGRKRGAAPVGGLILFHGAGGDREHHLFLALENGLDVPVARVNFPYRAKGPGRRPPDRMPKLVEAVAAASAEWAHRWGVEPGSIVLGGRSMGGRMASMLAAGDATDAADAVPLIGERVPVAGLALISYPLHPPGKPDNLRTEHLGRLTVPCLFVHGTRDPFGTPDELTAATAAVPGPVTHVWIDGGRHELARADARVAAAVAAWIASL